MTPRQRGRAVLEIFGWALGAALVTLLGVVCLNAIRCSHFWQ